MLRVRGWGEGGRIEVMREMGKRNTYTGKGREKRRYGPRWDLEREELKGRKVL